MTPSAARRLLPALFFTAWGALFSVKILAEVDPDLFFHLKEGERIVGEGRFPLREEYSFTAKGRDMVATEWIPQAVSWILFDAAGYPGVAFFHALLLLGSLIALYRATGPSHPEELRILLTCLAAFGYMNFCAARVQAYTFLFFSLFLLWTRAWEEGSEAAPWAMAVALGFWANMHGGFMAGWFLLTGICLLRLRKTGHPRELGPSLLGAFLCFLHPSGPMAFVYPAWFFFSPPPSRSMVLEWTPLDFSQANAAPTLLILGALAWTGLKGISTPFPWAALTLALLAASLRGRKLLPLFGAAAVVSMALKLRGRDWTPPRRKACLAGAAAVTLAMAWVVWPAEKRLASGLAADMESAYPRAAVQWAGENLRGRRLFHPYDWGGYLIYKLWPGNEVFIDGRLEPYWKLLGGDYRTAMDARPGWKEVLDGWGIFGALLSPTSRLAHTLADDQGWRAVYSDRKAIIFVRAEAQPPRPPASSRPKKR